MATFCFDEGAVINVPHLTDEQAKNVVGAAVLNGEMYLVGACSVGVNPPEMMYFPLTFCCAASGKGWSDDSFEGVVCRSCFEEVDLVFGDTVDERDVLLIPTKKDFALV